MTGLNPRVNVLNQSAITLWFRVNRIHRNDQFCANSSLGGVWAIRLLGLLRIIEKLRRRARRGTSQDHSVEPLHPVWTLYKASEEEAQDEQQVPRRQGFLGLIQLPRRMLQQRSMLWANRHLKTRGWCQVHKLNCHHLRSDTLSRLQEAWEEVSTKIHVWWQVVDLKFRFQRRGWRRT